MGKYITDEVIDEIRRKADIVELPTFTVVTKRGQTLPVARSIRQTPSFKLNQERQVYYCFAARKAVICSDSSGDGQYRFPRAEWLANRPELSSRGRKNAGEDSGEAARRRTMREEGRRCCRKPQLFPTLPAAAGRVSAQQYLRERGLDWG